MLVVNVAVTNWRFLYKLGLTGGRWFDGFGYFCNLRQQMVIGDYHPKLNPDYPNVLTFYAPFYAPGTPPENRWCWDVPSSSARAFKMMNGKSGKHWLTFLG
jgi:spermidine dehydrogenase